MTKNLEVEAHKVGLNLNLRRHNKCTKAAQGDKPSEITSYGKRFDAVQEFKYSEVMPSNRDDTAMAIKNITQANNRSYYVHMKFHKSKLLWKNKKNWNVLQPS